MRVAGAQKQQPSPSPFPGWNRWTEAELRQGWEDKLSLSAIALQLGTSKNAVYSRVRSLGLEPRQSPIQRNKPEQPRPPSKKPPPRAMATVEEARAARMAPQAPPRSCQWPTSEEAPWTFCGAQAHPKRPFCLAHCEEAYQGFVCSASVEAVA